MKRDRGFALITAIAISLVCFLIITAMVAVTRLELSATTGKALSVRRYFAARGQVQDLVHRINSGVPVNTLVGAPQMTEVDGILVEAEVTSDAASQGVYHLVARVGEQRLAETTIYIGEPSGGGSFAAELFDDAPFQIPHLQTYPRRFYHQFGQAAWTTLPELPMQAYDSSGALVAANRVSPFYAADARGHLVVSPEVHDSLSQPCGVGLYRYAPEPGGWEDLGPIPRLLQNSITGDFELSAVESENWPICRQVSATEGGLAQLALTRSGSELYEALNGLSEATFRMRDMATGTWRLLKGPADVYYGEDGSLNQFEDFGQVHFVAGGVESGAVCAMANVVARLTDPNLDPPQWEYLPPFPKHYYDASGLLRQEAGYFGHGTVNANVGGLAVGPAGEIYAYLYGPQGAVLAFFKYDGTEWQPLRPPDNKDFAFGDLLSVDGNGVLNLTLSQDSWQCLRYDGEVWRELPALAVGPAQRYKVVGTSSLSGESGRVLKTISR